MNTWFANADMQFCPTNFIVYFGSTFIVLLNVTSVHRTILLWVYIIFMLLVFFIFAAQV